MTRFWYYSIKKNYKSVLLIIVIGLLLGYILFHTDIVQEQDDDDEDLNEMPQNIYPV